MHAVDNTADDIFRYYHSSADAVMSRQLVSLPTDCAGSCVHELVDAWLSRFTEGQHSIWAVSYTMSMRECVEQCRGRSSLIFYQSSRCS